MKLLICGDRNITDYKILLEALKASGYENIDTVISGNANGVDKLGERYAKENGLILKIFKPDWKNLDAPGAIIKENDYGKYNSRAGMDRNEKMVDEADNVLAVQTNGPTSGTQGSVKYAKSKDKPVFEYRSREKYDYYF